MAFKMDEGTSEIKWEETDNTYDYSSNGYNVSRDKEFEDMQKELVDLRITLQRLENNQSGSGKRGILKPRDIEYLRLEELSSIEGIASKESFFHQITQVTDDKKEQVQVCLSRLDRDLRLFVESQIKHKAFSQLEDIQNLLELEFKLPRNLPDAIDRLVNTEVYSLDRDPREFVHRFKVKYGMLCTAFKNNGLPEQVKILKAAMTRGMDMATRAQLGSVLMEEFGEEPFLSRLEALRMGYNSTPVCNAIQGIGNLPICRYCKNGQRHRLKDCPRKPRWGSCFDCLEMGHKAGNSNCKRNQNQA